MAYSGFTPEVGHIGMPKEGFTGVERPRDFALSEAYPNPFNPATTVQFALPSNAHVSLTVLDVLGREVARLAEGFQETGYHSVTWNDRNAASGLYLVRLKVTDALGKVIFNQTNKLLLTKQTGLFSVPETIRSFRHTW